MKWLLALLCCSFLLFACQPEFVCVDRVFECEEHTYAFYRCGDMTKVLDARAGEPIMFYRGCYPANVSDEFSCPVGFPDNLSDECEEAIHYTCELIKNCQE